LLSAEWVAQATRAHVATTSPEPDWDQGYGFQFWRGRHGYRGDGAYSQLMLVLPEADAVVAITSQSPDTPGLLDALWTHLLPALTSSPAPRSGTGTTASAAGRLPGPAGSHPPGDLGPMAF
jgi:CubicO group peptidase (beta-lactamase class C family)